MDMLQQVRPWAELLYFTAGIVLAGVGVYGLQQIRLMKRDMEIRSQRAAREKAIEYISRYFAEFVPLQNRSFADSTNQGLKSYDGPLGDFTMASMSPGDRAQAFKRFRLNSWMPAFNELQPIAAAFVYGVADDQLGFQTIGRTFCATVASGYDILCIARNDSSCRHYQGIVDLFRRWEPRLTKSELTVRREHVDRQLAALTDETALESDED